MNRLLTSCALAALAMPFSAYAQSTGSQEVEEEEEIVVTGTRDDDGVEGIIIPDVPKARAVLSQEHIARQAPGQSILNTINLIPGVNYTNSDAYGSSGGNLRIRGFDGNRISLTQDGIPLNDTGNYAIFGNQQIDPEIIERVSVDLGTTNVDSPTASATGGTVNYNTRIPSNTLGGMLAPSFGEDEFRRVFGMIDTGNLTSFGTKAFASASYARNDKFKGPGEIYKQQYNARIYQPLGDSRDFVSVSAHYNQNRNNFYRNPTLADIRLLTPNRLLGVVGDFNDIDERAIRGFENLSTCSRGGAVNGIVNNDNATLFTPPTGSPTGTPSDPNNIDTRAGTANDPRNPSACTNFFGVRINPSNTGNVRGQARLSLTDNIRLTVDPSYQYVLANGGGSTVLNEDALRLGGTNTARTITVNGVTSANPNLCALARGSDLNGDGDFCDSVRVFTPNNTNTNRLGLTTSLIWDVNEQNTFRVAYTYDRGRHRQTGEFGFLDAAGRPENPFSGRNGRPVTTVAGNVVQQRDRLSIALLNQVAAEYRGEFLDERATVLLGVRAPFFKRELDQRCFTEARGSGFALCTDELASTLNIIQPGAVVPSTGPTPYYAPFKQNYKFDQLLPNIGASFKFNDFLSVFGSYAKGFSAPRTDNLYRAPIIDVQPETTDSFDLGFKYQSRYIQGQITGWKIDYKNRIVTAFDPDLGISVDRNVGKVESQGIDAGVGFQPVPQLLLYAFGSYTDAELQDDLFLGLVGAQGANVVANPNIPFRQGTQIFAPTAGKQVVETPKYQFGGRVEGEVGPFSLGFQGKFVGDRFATDVNDVKVEDYTTFDADARLDLSFIGLPRSFVQLNVINIFDKFYFGNIGTQTNGFQICPEGSSQCLATSTLAADATGVFNNTGSPNFSIGAPRTILIGLRTAF